MERQWSTWSFLLLLLLLRVAGGDSGFLVHPSRALELSETMDASALHRDASVFSGRHVAFIGDSTMSGLFHTLAAFLLTRTSARASDQRLRCSCASVPCRHRQGSLPSLALAAAARVRSLLPVTNVSGALHDLLRHGCPSMGLMRLPNGVHGGRCGYVANPWCAFSRQGCTSVLRVGDATLSVVGPFGNGFGRCKSLPQCPVRS